MSWLDDQVTVLIPTSPIPRHPHTGLIEECISAVRYYFPYALILIMADGVRPQVENRRDQYIQYKTCLRQKIDKRTELVEFEEFSQQAKMTRETLKRVTTPLILFVEHDAILRREPAIAWEQIFKVIECGMANVVRLYQWESIWPKHEYLMEGEFEFDGERFVRTIQYSQWPLVSSTAYHRLLMNSIPAGRYTMIEPAVYGKVVAEEWDKNKIVIYRPENAHTFYHRDGRTDEATGFRDPGDW